MQSINYWTVKQEDISQKDIDAFMKYIHPEPMSGCWIWIGGLQGRRESMYGACRVQGKTRHAHRFSYCLFKGIPPEGTELDHLCRTPCCVNPDHLEAVTKSVNLQRGVNGRKTHCPQGHLYSGYNLIIRTDRGERSRECRACTNARTLAFYHRKKAGKNA